ncbi:MAG: ATP-binding protein [Desulfobulbaceae bacterium]|nr:ATP-binding protein [Desulfobulbaceae bacterium]
MDLQQFAELQLQDIRKKAIAQDKLATVGQIAACAIHEMNQPLFFLSIFFESLIKNIDAGTGTLSDLGEEAREASHQLGRICKLSQQILRYSRPDQEPLSSQEVPLALERALILMAPQVKRAGVKISVTRDDVFLPILGNAGMLEQLFVNLLQNAIDAMAEQANKKIDIRFTHKKQTLVITFCDNGPGVPEMLQEKIFEPFFTTKLCGTGTGLGLVIVADIVRAHQGTIVLNTKKKRGATFIATFPVMQAQEKSFHLARP